MATGGLLPNLAAWDPRPFRARLFEAGFHREALEALGLPDVRLRADIRGTALLGHVPEASPLQSLIRLFTLGEPIEGELAMRALGAAARGLFEIGFLEAEGVWVRSRYQILPAIEGWVACDFPARLERDFPDFVLGIGPSSILLASLAPPSTGRTLELACGVGWLAGTLAANGRPVVATDLNPRALELGHFSALLNGVGGVDYRHGDGFSPVAGETFDLIVSNPPYVQSPGGNMIFKEAKTDDSICARLLRQLPAHLAPGGIAVMLINWTHAADEDWSEPPLSWVAPEGMRRWVFQTECSSPADYAWTWISRDARFRHEQAAAAEMRRWLAHYHDKGIKRISGGFIILQKCPPGGEWTRTESRALDTIGRTAGHDVLRVLDNETWLATHPPLLDSGYTVPEGVRAEARMSLDANGWTRETIRLTSPGRLSYDGQIDENLLRLLALVREGKTPSAMVEEIRSRPGFAAIPDLPERVAALVRELVSHGVLVPV